MKFLRTPRVAPTAAGRFAVPASALTTSGSEHIESAVRGRESAHAVAAMITQRIERAPGASSDEMAMSGAASQMTPQELAHIVASLRSSSAKH